MDNPILQRTVRLLVVLTAFAAITTPAPAQDTRYDYVFRIQAKGSYAVQYHVLPIDYPGGRVGTPAHFASGYAVGGEGAVRLKPGLALGITAASIRRDTLTSSIYGAALNIHTAPRVTLKVGAAAIRAPYHVSWRTDPIARDSIEIRHATMPALQLGGEFMHAPLGNSRVIFTFGMDSYIMLFSNRHLLPPEEIFQSDYYQWYWVQHRIVMVPVISAGAGILLGRDKTR